VSILFSELSTRKRRFQKRAEGRKGVELEAQIPPSPPNSVDPPPLGRKNPKYFSSLRVPKEDSSYSCDFQTKNRVSGESS